MEQDVREAIRVRPARRADAAAIAEIYNQGILERIATFEAEPRTVEQMEAWVDEHGGRYPALVGEIDGQVVGWASVGTYRPRACYAGIGEDSIYVHRDWRGRGLGKVLVQALIDEAERQGYWKLVSRIFTFNAASLKVARELGFREVGIYEKHAKLDDEWLDVVIVERLIPSNFT